MLTKWIIHHFVPAYEHTDHPKVRTRYGNVASIVGILCNVILFLGKLLVGTLANSVSITADAVNNLSDFSSSIVTFLGFKLASRPADKDHPYGHGRYEYLAGLFVSVFITVIGIEIFKTGLNKILHPGPVDYSVPSFIVMALSVGLKLWMMVFYRRVGKIISSPTLFAAAADSRNDVLTTVAVFAGALFTYITNINLDGIMAMLVSLFVIWNGFGLIKDTLDPILGKAPDSEYITRVRKKILSYPGVLGTHDLMVHDYGPHRLFATVHVEMDAEMDSLEAHAIIDKIQQDFMDEEGVYMSIHYEPVAVKSDRTEHVRQWLNDIVAKIDPGLDVHDLRIVPGSEKTRLIFDCIKPEGMTMDDQTLKAKIKEAVKAADPKYRCYFEVESYAPTAKEPKSDLHWPEDDDED